MNVHRVKVVRQDELYTVEPFIIHEPSTFESEFAVEKLKHYRSPHMDKVLTEFIQAVHKTLHFEVYSY